MTEASNEASASRLGELRLVHLGAPSADRAMAFFGPLFDWEAERALYRGHVRHYTINTSLTVVLIDDPAAAPATLCFQSEHPAVLGEEIQALGGSIIESDGERHAQCRDPQGAALTFFRPGTSQRRQEPTKRPSGEFAFALLIEDAGRARPFYSALVGREIVPVRPTSVYHDVVPGVGLIDAPGRPAGVVPYFAIDDLESARTRVLELGGEPGEPGGMGEYVGCECSDDQAVRFGICQLSA